MISRRLLFGTVLGALVAPQVRANEAEPRPVLMRPRSGGKTHSYATVVGAGNFNFYECDRIVLRSDSPVEDHDIYHRLTIADECALKRCYRLYSPEYDVDGMLDDAIARHNYRIASALLDRAGFPPRPVRC